MTDAEINLAIARIVYPKCSLRALRNQRIEVTFPASGNIRKVDYCGNWSDIGHIIEREKIDLKALSDGWSAGGYDLGFSARADTPTKAVALCYLRMKGIEV